MLLALPAADPAMALEFGDISVLSRLGQPFRAEVSLSEGADEGRPGAECFRVGKSGDTMSGLPPLSQARVKPLRDAGRTRLLVFSEHPVDEPAVQFSVQALCGPLQYRSYAVLLDPAPSRGSQAAPRTGGADRLAAAAPTAIAGKKPASSSGPEWSCEEGESARSIAASIFPNNAVARSRFLGALLNANPEVGLGPQGENRLRAGTVLRLPETRHLPAGKSARFDRQAPAGTSSPARETAKSSVIAEAGRPVEPSARPGDGKIVAAPNDTVSSPEPAPGGATPLAPAAIPAPATPAVPQKTPPPPDAEEEEPGIVDSLFGMVGEWWQAGSKIWSQDLGQEWAQWWQEILAASGILALLLFWRSRRQKATRRALTGGKAIERDPLSIIEDGVRPETKVSRTQRLPSAAPPDAGGNQGGELQWAAQRGEAMVVTEENEFNPVMELAEIMLSFGRVKGAAQALQEYIDKSPNEALQPWMKLLEVYRQGDMRPEFEGLSEKLKLHFNVAPADWETMADQISPPVTPVDVEKAPVEQLLNHLPNVARMTRIRDEIVRTWDSAAGFDYLNTLLRDNRKGERQGFPLAVVSELLYLMDILEKRLKRLAA
ncbi:MAG: hypothetical protein HY777_11945 [Betaproteobacteria bacterium]|nr:hypothetical protein [Betaproteobacteria bacterium]